MKNKNKLIAGIFLALFGFQASATISYDDTYAGGSSTIMRKCTGNEFDKYLEEEFGVVKILTSVLSYDDGSQIFLAIHSNEIVGEACHVGHLRETSHNIEFIFDEETGDSDFLGRGGVEGCDPEGCVSYEYLGNNKVSVRTYNFSDLQETSHNIEFIFDEEKDELEEGVECDAGGCVSYEYLGNNKVSVSTYTFSDFKKVDNIEENQTSQSSQPASLHRRSRLLIEDTHPVYIHPILGGDSGAGGPVFPWFGI